MSTADIVKCMKCNSVSEALLCSFDHLSMIGSCYHISCSNCFKNENNFDFKTKKPKCPCCSSFFYEYVESIEEALLIGEAAYFNYDAEIRSHNLGRDKSVIHTINNKAIELFEKALLLSPSNIITIFCTMHSCLRGLDYCREIDNNAKPAQYPIPSVQKLLQINSAERHHCRQTIFDCCLNLLEKAYDSHGKSLIHIHLNPLGQPTVPKLEEFYSILGTVFHESGNQSAALKYAKLAYETSLRSGRSGLGEYKSELGRMKKSFDEEAPLRFAVGEQVEFLHEREGEGGTEWRLGQIVELYYRERSFPMVFTAPYRLQLLEASGAVTDPPVYAYIRADLDRYIRKKGVKLMEDTRYQAQLDAKVEELAQVFCSKEFVRGIYRMLAQDLKFVEMLDNLWDITLSERVLHLYRMLVMYRQPLVRIDSGYHVPTADEVIAGIKAYFDSKDVELADLSAAANEHLSDERRIKAIIIAMFQRADITVREVHFIFEIESIDGMYMRAFNGYPVLYYYNSDRQTHADTFTLIENGFTIPLPPGCLLPEVSAALATVAGAGKLEGMISDPLYAPARRYLILWKQFVKFLDMGNLGPACECPLVYFFVKYCLDQGVGVPKPALAVYDRMNMQLSREFIRCANPTCKHNKLDQSTGQVKFKKCSRCQAVIYCSRECQVAHYPEHKRLCREHSTG